VPVAPIPASRRSLRRDAAGATAARILTGEPAPPSNIDPNHQPLNNLDRLMARLFLIPPTKTMAEETQGQHQHKELRGARTPGRVQVFWHPGHDVPAPLS